MAIDTVASTEALKTFANEHANTLYDIVALLDAAADRIDAVTPNAVTHRDDADSMHNTLRLVQMAGEKAKEIAERMAEVT